MVFAGNLRAENATVEPMSQGELAKKICFISGLAESMKAPITFASAVSALSERGWTPLNGWRIDSYATREDFYVVMAKYMGLHLEGPADQAQSYYHALATEGLFVDSGQGLADSLNPAPPRLSSDTPVEVSRMVLMSKGTVEFRREEHDQWKPLNAYDPIVEGMEIRTQAQGEASLAYASGCAQQIAENSLVRIKKLSTGPIAVAIQISYGKVYTLVKPLPAGSSFMVESRWGNLDVDINEGCEIQSVVESDEPIALNDSDRQLALGNSVLAPIQQGRSEHTSFQGRALGRHSGGGQEFLKCGEVLSFLADGLRLGKAESFDFGKVAGLVVRLEKLTHEFLLTEFEVRAFLQNLSSGGTCEIHVTPIGR